MTEYQRTVTTQAELDQAIADKVALIDVRSPAGVWLDVCDLDPSATVSAWDSATVRAWGSATVHASDSATVHAWDSATVHAWDSATVHATSHCAVHLHDKRVSLTGGVVIDHTAVDLTDAQTWCDYHGVHVQDGIAVLYKAVDDRWTTPRGVDYSPGSAPEAPDFNRTDQCGGGLHFGPSPLHALAYHPEATRYVAVGVRLDELVPITSGGTAMAKAKARRVVVPCREVDEAMRPVTREGVSS